MNIQELQWFLKRCDTRIKIKYGAVESPVENALWSFTKLAEEVGELAEQIHKRRWRQDPRKGEFKLEDLEDELADVIFAASMLSKV